MKVKLLYSCDLSHLNEELSKRVSDTIKPTQDVVKSLCAFKDILSIDGDKSIEYVSSALDRLRQKLSVIDESLNEINVLLNGYVTNIIKKEQSVIVPNAVENKQGTPENTKVWDPKTRSLKTREELEAESQ